MWLPQIFTVAKLKDLTDDQRLAASQSLSFVPAALIYMEELQETVDDFVLRTARSSEGAEQVLRLMCDLLATTVALSRARVRHNDLMLKNAMVRRRHHTPTVKKKRVLTLHTTEGTKSFTWRANSHYELVLIDFGLASVAPPDLCAGTDGGSGMWTHTERDRQFGSSNVRHEVLHCKAHPLECYKRTHNRNLLDLNCIWWSLQSYTKKEFLDAEFRKWCLSYVKTICKLNRDADASRRPLALEDVVAKVLPTQALVIA